MATKKKLLQAAAGAAGGAGLNVEEVFSTYLYTGNNSNPRTITNGIDLAGEGGLVWTKARGTWNSYNLSHILSIGRGSGNASWLSSDTSDAGINTTDAPLFLSDGYQITANNYMNSSTTTVGYASWTFRKAPKFFDVVTFSGNSTARTISHNLGTAPGFMVVKRTSGSGTNWMCFHRSVGATKGALLNGTNAFTTDSTTWNDTAPTDSVFSLGTDGNVNKTGHDYVAYLFAHNDGDGGFGPDGDADIIKCGVASYPVSGDVEVNLGWEPQWVLLKDINHSGQPWWIIDTMRGWAAQETAGTLSSTTGGKWEALFANTSGAEVEYDYGGLTSTGFKLPSNNNYGDGNTNYIYIAIRRGPMAVPESATDVFATETQGATTPNPPAFTSGFVVDAALFKQTNGATNWHLAPRLTQNKYMFTDTSDSEQTNSTYDFDFNNGWLDTTSVQSAYRSWMWKRAPNYFDVVCYTGNGSAGHTVSHNLGVAPEMMWVKRRNGTGSWAVYHAGIASDAETDYIYLDYNFSAGDDATFWNDTAPTASDFTLGNGGGVNSNNQTYIAYLFASLAGISKVGSYTGNNTSQTIDCGFSAGARFVIIKRTDFSGSWYLWDSARGIVAGNDPYLLLDTNAAEVSSYDWIDPDNSGFIVNSTTVNASSGNYIFYAIA